MALTDPDKSGGLGSIAGDLRGILTGALNQVAAPALGKLLGIGDLRQTVDAEGNIVSAAAPSTPPKVTAQLADLFKNPLVLAAGIAAVITVVVLIARK